VLLSYLDQPVAPLPVIADVRDRFVHFLFRRRIRDETRGFVPRNLQNLGVANEVADPERRQSALLRAKKFTRTTQFQIHLRDIEPVVGFDHRANPLARGVAGLAGHQDAVALIAAAPDSPAQLMELRKSEP